MHIGSALQNHNTRVMPPRPSSAFLASQRAFTRFATKPTNVPLSSRIMSTSIPSETAQAQASADASAPSFSSIGIKRTNIETAPGVSLSEQQKVLVGSVLDVGSHPVVPVLPCNEPLADITGSFSRVTRPSSTSAFGIRMPHSPTTSQWQPAIPSTLHSSMASQRCSNPSSCSRTRSSPQATPSSWT